MNWLRAFLRGMTYLVNPFAGRDEVRRILERSDRDALASDWKAVGDDMRKVLNEQRYR